MTKARTLADNFAADINGITAGTGITGGGTSGTVTITNDMATTIAAKGDLVVGTANDTYAALTVGSNNTVLTADSTTATGLKWATPSSGSLGSFTLLNTGGTNLTGATTITISSISAKAIMVLVVDGSTANASSDISFRLNADSGLKYSVSGFYVNNPSTYSTTMIDRYAGYQGLDGIPFARMGSNASSEVGGALLLLSADTTGFKAFNVTGGASAGGGNSQRALSISGIYEATAAITSVSVVSSAGNFDAGKIYVYGAN